MDIPYIPLVHWNRLWEFKNSAVRCRSCSNIQPEFQVRSPFMHQLDCMARTPDHQYPLRELQQIFLDKARLGFNAG